MTTQGDVTNRRCSREDVFCQHLAALVLERLSHLLVRYALFPSVVFSSTRLTKVALSLPKIIYRALVFMSAGRDISHLGFVIDVFSFK
jgi:hypothetical protein